MLKWDTSYNLGIETIDMQHQELLKIINKLGEKVELGKDGVDIYDELIMIIDELKDYTIYHFTFEENMLLENNYPDLENHKLIHSAFVKQLNDISYTDLDSDTINVGTQLIKFLVGWLFKHIAGVDTKYTVYIK